MKVHCLFEQSGTFKNEFKKLGIEAEDYDILNDFGETDHVIDLFSEIEGGVRNEPSIFDTFDKGDLIMAFFPCVRFEDQIVMGFQGCLWQMRNWDDVTKLEYDIKLHKELHTMYVKITQLALIAYHRGIPMIIENPYGSQHYLSRYWAIKPKLIDKNRKLRGDYYQKPTQYWFINCEPKMNFIMEPMVLHEAKPIEQTHNKVERSLLSKDYANRFIREFILDEERLNEFGDQQNN